MTLFLILLSTITIFHTIESTQYGENCYETLETIQLRWTLEKLNSTKKKFGEEITSPLFPIEATSETKWYLRFLPKGGTDFQEGVAGVYICLESLYRESEVAGFSVSVLDRDFDSSGSFLSSGIRFPYYFSNLPGGSLCWMTGSFPGRSHIANRVSTSGDVELMVIVDRLRKFPECLKPPETDLGRGKMTTLRNPPITRATHCTTRTDVIKEILYNWIGQLPPNPENGFEVTSPIFPATEDRYQWQLVLKKETIDNNVGVFMNLVSKSAVNASFAVIFNRNDIAHTTSTSVHEYTLGSKPFGKKSGNFATMKHKCFGSDNIFNATVHVSVLIDEEICEVVCPLQGLQPLASNYLRTEYGKDSIMDTSRISQLEALIKDLQETTKELRDSNKELRETNKELRETNKELQESNRKLENVISQNGSLADKKSGLMTGSTVEGLAGNVTTMKNSKLEIVENLTHTTTVKSNLTILTNGTKRN